MSSIGSKIKQRREELGMTQTDLALKLGYTSKSTINKIETGINDITQSKIIKFANALDVSVSYLMGWNNDIETFDHFLNDYDIKFIKFIHENPEYKILFDYVCKIGKEDIKIVEQIIGRFISD